MGDENGTSYTLGWMKRESKVWLTFTSRSSKTIEVPAIEIAGCNRTSQLSVNLWDFPRLDRCIFCPELFVESQLIVVWIQFGRLKQSSNLRQTLSLGGLCGSLLLLLLLSIKFCVVTSEFL